MFGYITSLQRLHALQSIYARFIFLPGTKWNLMITSIRKTTTIAHLSIFICLLNKSSLQSKPKKYKKCLNNQGQLTDDGKITRAVKVFATFSKFQILTITHMILLCITLSSLNFWTKKIKNKKQIGQCLNQPDWSSISIFMTI